MPNIIINEIDETSAGLSAQRTDVVYIPGIAKVNTNCYIYRVSGKAPQTSTVGTAYSEGDTIDTGKGTSEAPTFAINVVDKKAWKCTAKNTSDLTTYTWEQLPSYIEPHPENEPMLCNTVMEFEGYFGDTPYVFDAEQRYAGFEDFAMPTGSDMYEVGDCEKSYIMAKELVYMGLPVLYENIVKRSEEGKLEKPTVANMYAMLPNALDNLNDKGEYTVKYITTGAYPTFEFKDRKSTYDIMNKAIQVAKTRGDAVAIIDHTNNPARSLKTTDGNSVYAKLKELNVTDAEFATMFTPWAVYSCPNAPTGHGSQTMPASFGYLMSLAQSLRTNASWKAVAGVARGQVPYIMNLNVLDRLSNTIADAYQPRNAVALNAITNVKPYGLTIWGNRTLVDNASGNLTAKSFLNIRNLVSDVKKVAYTAAKKAIFEQNSDILWLNFKSEISPLLEQMVTGNGIKDYKIIRGTTTEKAKVVALIRLYPIYAVEDFEITVVMSDEEVSVS